MNDDQMNDLKQLIATTVQQAVKQEIAEAEERITTDLGGRIGGLEASLSKRIDDLREEMREGFAGVGDAFAPANDQLADHEQRITTLEQQAA